MMVPERQFVDEAYLSPTEEDRLNWRVYTNNNRRKPKRRLKRLSQKQKLIICLSMIFVLCLVYVSLEAKITQVGYSVNQLKSEIADAQEANDRLMVEVEQLESPERIAKYAAQKDGMVVAGEDDILYSDIEVPNKEQSAETADSASNSDKQQKATNRKTKQQEEDLTVAENGGIVGAFSSLMDRLSAGRNKAAASAE